MCPHTAVCVLILLLYVLQGQRARRRRNPHGYVSIRRYTSAYVDIRQHISAYVRYVEAGAARTENAALGMLAVRVLYADVC